MNNITIVMGHTNFEHKCNNADLSGRAV